MAACLLTVHHVLPDDALKQLDSIDQMYHDGLLTEKVQAKTVEKSRCSGTICILAPVGLVLLRVWMFARDVYFNMLVCCTRHLLLP